ncbi:hypothetical protein [Streptomyces sp. FH025]|uniref:hypothetical protein n=1 Tax=Streptomyces sp. FH025 TaxID=2815937 RepID=UPI001A9CFDDC|nr:hypothetical protein [Streptomyces sp. FH025]MBO1418842.1 hypothetical protein [Streptomyces sp. FH025]
MPSRLLAALLILLSLLSVTCGQRHAGAPAAVRSHGTSALSQHGAPSEGPLRCDAGEVATGTARSGRPALPTAPATPSPSAPAEGGNAVDVAATRPEGPAGSVPAGGPRGPLLVTGRWRI